MAKEKDDLIEKLLEDIDFRKLKPEQITGESGLLKQLTRRLVEKAMNAGVFINPAFGVFRGC